MHNMLITWSDFPLCCPLVSVIGSPCVTRMSVSPYRLADRNKISSNIHKTLFIIYQITRLIMFPVLNEKSNYSCSRRTGETLNTVLDTGNVREIKPSLGMLCIRLVVFRITTEFLSKWWLEIFTRPSCTKLDVEQVPKDVTCKHNMTQTLAKK